MFGRSHTLILIDGQPVTSRNAVRPGRGSEQDTRGDSQWVPPSAIERIEVLRGPAAARYFEYYAGIADKIEGISVPLGKDYINFTQYQPMGVSVQIVPWNFPVSICARSLAPALAAGNAVVVKSPEISPIAMTLLYLLYCY